MNFIKKRLQGWLVDLVLSDVRLQGQESPLAQSKARDEAVSLMKEWLYGQDKE